MYNQGNNQQYGRRLPAVLPPPPPTFQLGRPAPPAYALASSASMQLGPPVSVPPSGMLNSGQSYSIPPPPPPPHSYSNGPQNSNWNQNQHISQSITPGHHLTTRIPPPHPQGQHFYRVPGPPLLPGGMRGLQQAPQLLPPPPTSSYFTHAPFGSLIQPVHESSLVHLPPPPPPPSSPPPGPPPLPPSSPPPNSPLHMSLESLSTEASLSPSSRKSPVFDMVASAVIDRSNEDGYRSNDTLRHDNSLNCTTVNGSETSVTDTSGINTMSDIPSPPPRPRDENTVKKIEVLCQYIAKNGHEFEKMTCQKEVDNPEFNFLFGGAPGSEAAISHEYFKWMKNKCSSSELLEGRRNIDIGLESSGIGSSMQPDGKLHAGISHSPAGSDMDMEDDITQLEEPGSGKSLGSAKHDPAVISNEVDIRVEEHAHDPKHKSRKDGAKENLFCSVSAGVNQQGTNLLQDDMHFEKSLRKDDVADSERRLDNKAEQPSLSLPQEAIQSGASAAAKVCTSEVPDELIRGTSPFRLIQGYASDDSSQNDNEPHLVNVSPEPVSPQVKEGITGLHSLQTDVESKNSSEFGKEFRTEDLEKRNDLYLVKKQVEEDNDRHNQAFVDGGNSVLSSKQNDSVEGDDTAGPKSLGDQKEGSNAKLEVDEFGRMVKAGASDSDSDDYSRRRGKRGRSRSRSRSPIGRRRRRRSPWRRREKRSRSRSWSPRKRSRSRSPYRHKGETGGDWSRRNRSHLPVCYDFRLGKCFRGASCRYVHESEKSEEARGHKNKQQYKERSERVRSFDKFVPKEDIDNQEMQLYQDVDKSSDRPREEFVEPSVHSAEVARAHETLDVNKLARDVPAPPLTDVDEKNLLAVENTEPTGSAIPVQVLTDEGSLKQMSPAEAELPLPSLSQGTHGPSQLAREYNIMPTSNYPLYQAPLSSENPYSAVPPTSSWNPLPPPPPRPQLGGVLPHYQQNQLPVQVNYPFQVFARPYAPEMPTHSQVGEPHLGVYPTAVESQRPLTHTEDFRPRAFPLNYPTPHQPRGPRIFGEENFARIPSPSLVSSNSNTQGDNHPHSLRFTREPQAGVKSYSGENVPLGGFPIPSSEGHASMSRYGLQNPLADNISTLGEPGKVNSRYTTDFHDGGQVSGISDFGRSRMSHYNPYASTFDQPLSTKFSSGIFSQYTGTSYINKYGASGGQSDIPDEGKGVGSISSKKMNTSPTSMRIFAHNQPWSGDDQYDPLFDSIEPSSKSSKKSDHGNNIEGTAKPDMLRPSGSNKLLDASTSVDNDEFGETADGEVGAVENDSPSSPIDLPDVATGEIEIDQVKNPGKTKKSKDSRSMKLFKVALADFVKEVLKPSWRQGNMSKEAFKTIVKKTVDKVSGAMKKHQLPKSQAKINHYIDSSQRKLTKLVMGYVDKYVKV